MTAQAFSHRIPDAALADLHARLAATRLPLDEANDWTAGTNPTYLRELLDYWRTRFDWRAIERQLHQLSHHVATLSGTRIHFIHERGRGPAPLPLLLTHGFPDSFARFIKLIPLLTAPADPRDAFDVVVPSLPGFGFSGPPNAHSDLFHLADRWHELMTDELGYTRFAAHGGDWGSTITEHLARSHSTSRPTTREPSSAFTSPMSRSGTRSASLANAPRPKPSISPRSIDSRPRKGHTR